MCSVYEWTVQTVFELQVLSATPAESWWVGGWFVAFFNTNQVGCVLLGVFCVADALLGAGLKLGCKKMAMCHLRPLKASPQQPFLIKGPLLSSLSPLFGVMWAGKSLVLM